MIVTGSVKHAHAFFLSVKIPWSPATQILQNFPRSCRNFYFPLVQQSIGLYRSVRLPLFTIHTFYIQSISFFIQLQESDFVFWLLNLRSGVLLFFRGGRGKNKDRPARTPNVVLWLSRIIKAFKLSFCSNESKPSFTLLLLALFR